MNPKDALHQQELLREACSRPKMQDYLSTVVNDIRAKDNGPVVINKRGFVDGPTVGQNLQRLLTNAETFYVSEDMTAVAQMAAHGLDGTDRFTHDMWPADTGFLLFDRGYVVKDVWDRAVVTSAIAWQRHSFHGHPGTVLWAFTMLGDERDALSKTMTPQQEADMAHRWGSRLQLNATMFLGDEQRVGPPTFQTPEGYGKARLDPEVEETLLPEDRAVDTVPFSANPARIIMALLLLMGQTLASKERHDLRPKNPTRARRMKIPGQVTVIRLRHEAAQREPGESQVEWQHRWLVRGHWRWQPVGPNYPMAVEVSPGEFKARIYIAPFVKGPEGKPFAMNKKVTALVR